MSVLSLLNILASCAAQCGTFDGDGVSPGFLLFGCVGSLLMIGRALLINRNIRE